MAQTFPWPVTDDELVLNRALENVVAAYGGAGPLEAARLRKAAAKLIFEAYDQGIRDEDVLVHQVLKTLRARPVRYLSGTGFLNRINR
jgi:tRNA(Arg) A34 adenosine deaminase TadA